MAYRQEELVSEIISESGVLDDRHPQSHHKRSHKVQDLRTAT